MVKMGAAVGRGAVEHDRRAGQRASKRHKAFKLRDGSQLAHAGAMHRCLHYFLSSSAYSAFAAITLKFPNWGLALFDGIIRLGLGIPALGPVAVVWHLVFRNSIGVSLILRGLVVWNVCAFRNKNTYSRPGRCGSNRPTWRAGEDPTAPSTLRSARSFVRRK
jgi:hypothetical protein